MSAFWYAPPLTPTKQLSNSATPTFDNTLHPSHYKIPLMPSPSSPKKQESLQDTDSLLTSMLSNLTTETNHFPTLAPFSTPETKPMQHVFKTNSKGAIEMNEDIFVFKKKGSQEQFSMSDLDLGFINNNTNFGSNTTTNTANIFDTIDLSPLKQSLPMDSPFIPALPSRVNTDRVTNTALEVMKMSMMTLTMRDEEDEHDAEWEGYGTFTSSSAARRRRHRGAGATSPIIHQRETQIYVNDGLVKEDRPAGTTRKFVQQVDSWRQNIPRVVCNVGMQVDSTRVLRDDDESKVRRRHPYYRPPSASHHGRTSVSPIRMEMEETAYQGSDGAYGVYHSDVY
ncbi:UNVERIFIED_CONTAM: hypothetical protein HDU68_007500 [Siphonaria sp. JEL0065]|nr:hypothetical protein HDU68_007500 [Siphonaria sp. JEL0065]